MAAKRWQQGYGLEDIKSLGMFSPFYKIWYNFLITVNDGIFLFQSFERGVF